MKKIFYILLLILPVSAFISCEDLNEETYTMFKKEGFYQKPAHLESATLGLYSYFGGMKWKNFMEPLSTKPYKYTRMANSAATKPAIYTASFSTPVYKDAWTMYYSAINGCNALMAAAPHTPFPAAMIASGKAQTTINTSLGEAYFLRAWSYFNLVVLFGDVPLHLKETTTINDAYLPRSSVKEVYETVISDLKTAIEYLPNKHDILGRVTKKSAIFLLGKAYLQMAGLPLNDKTRYQDAINTLRDLGNAIHKNNSAKYDCSMLSDIEKVYDIDNKNNQEIIFSLQCSRDLLSNNQCTIYAPPAPGKAIIGTTPFAPQEYQISFDKTLYDKYNDKDERKLKLWAYKYVTRAGTTATFGTGAYNRGISISKYKDPYSTVVNQQGNNIVIYRAPEVLLLLAEAHNEVDNLDSAAMYLNGVRTRVSAPEYRVGTDFDSKISLGEKIRLERELELVGECGEIFDMRRLGEVEDHLVNHLDPFTREDGIQVYLSKYELCPIPKVEIDNNPYIKANNAGW